MNEKPPLAFCPHCCNRTPHEVQLKQECRDTFYTVSKGEDYGEEGEATLVCYVATCGTCDHVLLYSQSEFDDSETPFAEGNLLYPSGGLLDNSVPPRIAKIYKEAFSIRHTSPSAFAVQIRRALEAVCLDRGVANKTLAANLKSLAQRGEIPPVLAEVTDALRAIGNIGAHAADEDVRPWLVHPIDEFFFRAVIEYIYVAPAKVAAFRKSMEYEKSRKNSAAPGPRSPSALQPLTKRHTEG
jgi:hypothetical protein